jgi:hypothetical protein
MAQTRNIITLEIILIRPKILLFAHLEEAKVLGRSFDITSGKLQIQSL